MLRCAIVLSLLATPAAAIAHHGWSSYDESRAITLTGTFTQVEWSNPHASARMRWKGKAWDVVLAPTARMESRGLTPTDIEKGQTVTITAYARRDGTPEMRVERVRVGDKTVELR